MSSTIWKYQLRLVDGRQSVFMPIAAAPLRVAMQADSPCLWALVDPEADQKPRGFAVIGTGHKIPEGATYVGSCDHMGTFVWHVFELPAL